MPTRANKPTVVVMAKPAIAGQVKTRLTVAESERRSAETADRALTDDQAARVHRALLQCVIARVRSSLDAQCVLAMSGGQLNPTGSLRVTLAGDSGPWRIIDQGTGDLGRRLDHVWRLITDRGEGGVIFLGVDSPDLPKNVLASLPTALGQAEVVLGPSDDGGYWTLGASRYQPPLLREIDWGGPSVYDQTVAAATSAGLSVHTLPVWDDVDSPADLKRLRDRLRDADEPALVTLGEELDAVLEPAK